MAGTGSARVARPSLRVKFLGRRRSQAAVLVLGERTGEGGNLSCLAGTGARVSVSGGDWAAVDCYLVGLDFFNTSSSTRFRYDRTSVVHCINSVDLDLRNGNGRVHLISLAYRGEVAPVIPSHLGSICGQSPRLHLSHRHRPNLS
jgi:hypothetical protein